MTEEARSETLGVYRKLYAVMAELPWIEKDGNVSMGGRGGYAYATEAGFISAIRPLLIKHQLVIVPIQVAVKTETVTVNDKTTYASTVTCEYEIVDIEFGGTIRIQMAGAGNDNGDKHIYKALTGAFKYALRETFFVGTGDDPEASNEDGGSTAVMSPLETVAEIWKNTPNLPALKDAITLLKNNGYVWGKGFSADEQKTALVMRKMIKAIKGGATLDSSIN